MRISVLATLALVAALTGCANSGYYQPSSTSAQSGSGITVFGELDANVTRTR
jgi:ABC-type molybdate transport system substrate-binding protein